MKDQLLNPLRSIARDLVEKKLWPIAALLVVALVAVPFVIGGGAEPASSTVDAPASPAVGGAVQPKSLVTLAEPAVTGKSNRAGAVEDPFYDPPAAPEADAGAAGASAAGGTTAAEDAAADAAKGGDTASADKSAETTTTPQAVEPAAGPAYYRTVVRWYQGDSSKPRPLSRLTPLGGLLDTAALYLGVTKSSGNYAVFLLGPNATSDGEARCQDPKTCRVIGLKSGQTQLVTVKGSDSEEARQYVLEVVSVRSVKTDADTASTMRSKVHADGRDVMSLMREDKATADAVGPIQYDRDSGLLVTSSASTGAATAAAEPAE